MDPGRIPLSKRGLDLIITVPVMIIFSPIYLFITALVYWKLGNPIFFHQQRPGYRGKPFTIYKFRTMNEDKDCEGNLLPDNARLTNLGKFLRASSLDELPELFLVLSGKMSLVGPRPLLMSYLPRYSQEQARRHDVLPGITGWAQINGRNALTWPDKFAMDVWYVDNWSLWLDLKILGLTLWKVLKREGINQPGHATAEEFKGNKLN